MKVIRLFALRTGGLHLPGGYPWYSFLSEGHSAAVMIKSMKANDTIGNRTRDLPACSAVAQPTATHA